jgi:uncharacterized protein (DUF58 family)
MTRRSPAGAPGPGPSGTSALPGGGDAAVLRRLELTVTRRLDGLLLGDHHGLAPGQGTELGETREYQPGDDVRRLDWNVTARLQVPHVRIPDADRELETWLLVDQSASLDFGTASMEKRDLALAAAAAVGFLTNRGGNRVGAVLLRQDGSVTVPARSSRGHVMALLRRVQEAPRLPGAPAPAAAAGAVTGAPVLPTMPFAAGPGRPEGLVAGLERVAGVSRRRGLVVVISDWLDGTPADPAVVPAWRNALSRLAVRHEVIAAEILDPRELALPDIGLVRLVDPETGRVREVRTSRAVRDRYAAAAAAQRDAVADAIRSSGAGHLRLSTDRDWLLDVVRFVAGRRRRASVVGAHR